MEDGAIVKARRRSCGGAFLAGDSMRGAVEKLCKPNTQEQERSEHGDIAEWDVSRVTNMDHMFMLQVGFNEDISGWDVSNATHMGSIFYGASSFNQP